MDETAGRGPWWGGLMAWSAARRGYSLPGSWTALALAALSFTPSLIPRPALFQALLAAITAAIGYGLGVVGARVWREFADRPPRRARPGAWRAFAVVAVVVLLGSVLLGLWWQRRVAALVGLDPQSPLAALLIPPVAAVVYVLLVGAGRLLASGTRRLSGRLATHMGARAARATGVVLVVAMVLLTVNGVLGRVVIGGADSAFSVRDTTTAAGVTRPTSTDRSGGPGSVITWEELGLEGRSFVARGPNADGIAAVNGTPAMNPIRAYSGLDSSDDAMTRAALAVRDLERAGGFERANLLVATTTGTGWVEPSAASSFEYLSDGDSAIVSMQYSHLPSPISFLVDQERARDAGRALFDAVYETWSALPADERPRLFVFGESLGSFGGETAFSGEYDLANRTSGALFVGPPNFNPLYRRFVDRRDARSPEVEPVYGRGSIVRFTTSPADTVRPVASPWGRSRVLYLQHASDPITWWSPDLILQRPDWLEEPRGRDVLGATRWIPFVTFWQLTADMALSMEPGPGHGHNFSGEHVDAWAAIMQPEDWSAARSERLKGVVREGLRDPYVATP